MGVRSLRSDCWSRRAVAHLPQIGFRFSVAMPNTSRHDPRPRSSAHFAVRRKSSRRGGRAADCTGFENQRAERHRGFESPPLRHFPPLAERGACCAPPRGVGLAARKPPAGLVRSVPCSAALLAQQTAGRRESGWQVSRPTLPDDGPRALPARVRSRQDGLHAAVPHPLGAERDSVPCAAVELWLVGQIAPPSPRRWSPSGTPGTRNRTLMAAPFRA